MVRLRRVALAMVLLAIAPTAVAGKLEKEAIEVGPGIDPPRADRTSSTPLHDVPSAIEGHVKARLLIDATGVVRKSKILDSTDARLTNRARQLLSGAKYIPAKRDGVPVTVWWTETLNFVSAEAEIASVLACNPSKIGSSPPIDPKSDPDLVLPVLLRDAVPQTTAEIRRRGSGFARLVCIIDVCGRVNGCTVLASSGGEYSEAAIAAAQGRLYRPARRENEPIAVFFTLTISFQF